MKTNDAAVLVIGASSEIARELIRKILQTRPDCKLIAISRRVDPEFMQASGDRILWLQSDYSEESMQEIKVKLSVYSGSFVQVFICNGVLHNNNVWPEKRLADVNASSFIELMKTNALLPVLWLKHLKGLFSLNQECVITVFSARVGSISDNKRGGWYGYRASKAALNMLLKTAAIEYTRFAKNIRFLSFHPGTTDTPLSKPFQRSVEESKLFAPKYVAERLLNLLSEIKFENVIEYRAWDGNAIDW